MEYPKFRVIGQVINRQSKQGIRGLRVEAWDKDQKYHDLLGFGVTDRSGHFLISFDQTYFREYAPEKYPDLFFRIYLSQRLLKSTEDSVIWNVRQDTEVTIAIDMPTAAPAGKDRVSAWQVFKAADFVQRSDFRGLWKETGDKGGAAVGFLTDMVVNTISKVDVEPIKVGDHKTSDVINQDVASASRNLEKQKITVSEVKPYQPGLNAQSFKNVAALPVTLKPGQQVNLYAENGKVRYYTVVSERKPSDVHPQKVIRLENELETVKKKSAEKDLQIAELEKEVKSIGSRQTRMEKTVTGDTIAELQEQLKELQDFKTRVEKATPITPTAPTTRKKTTTVRTQPKKKT